MLRFFLICFFLFSANLLHAQELRFDIRFKGKPLKLNKNYNLNGQRISISKCKFYISEATFNTMSWPLQVTTDHLVDASNPSSLNIELPKDSLLNFQDVKYFQVGIDSTKNVSGAFGGDLDPTNGMYWSWQSGYINIKIEGTSPDCPARKNKFQFHLGGYAHPNNTMRKVELSAKYDGKNFTVALNLDTFFEAINIKKDYQIMSPNADAMRLSDIFAKCFTGYEK